MQRTLILRFFEYNMLNRYLNWSYEYRTRKMWIKFAYAFNTHQVNVTSIVSWPFFLLYLAKGVFSPVPPPIMWIHLSPLICIIVLCSYLTCFRSVYLKRGTAATLLLYFPRFAVSWYFVFYHYCWFVHYISETK